MPVARNKIPTKALLAGYVFMAKAKSKATSKAKKDIAATYNQYKIFRGQQYTGVKIGRGHKWYYDKGVWKDKKVGPDDWEIHYAVTKRRAGHAPEGSGAPVGTEYHWYILAHQFVKKLNANDYSTELKGMKFKLAHKRSDKDKWSASEKAQKKKLIKILQNFIKDLEKEPVQTEVEKKIKPLKKKTVAKKKTKVRQLEAA
jgi:hypothetical protein